MSRRRGRDPSPAVAEPAPVVVAPLPAHPTDSLPPALRTLRRSYELASVSQFIGLFGTGIGIKDFDVEVSPTTQRACWVLLSVSSSLLVVRLPSRAVRMRKTDQEW